MKHVEDFPIRRSRAPRRLAFVLLSLTQIALLGLPGSPGRADDRDLLRRGSAKPYVFILFDTSGSMHWSPKCTADQLAAGDCDFLCPTGDCFVPRNGDDPSSKFYQAKAALYDVIEATDNVDFGFATYNQDELRVTSKHWLYSARGAGVSLDGTPFPAAGSEEVFGAQWPCDTGNGDDRIGCYRESAASLADPWELDRVRRLPKGGNGMNQTRQLYVRERHRHLRDHLHAAVRQPGRLVDHLPDQRRPLRPPRLPGRRRHHDRHLRPDRPVHLLGPGHEADQRPARLLHPGRGIRRPGGQHLPGLGRQRRRQQRRLRQRQPALRHPDQLALPAARQRRRGPPRLDHRQPRPDPRPPGAQPLLGESIPDFSVARYLEDQPGGNGLLEPADRGVKPLIAFGSTPLGNSIRDFRTWYAGCSQGACPHATGWRDLAEANDPDWGCRKVYLLVITDGDDTCPGADACSGTASLFAQEDVKTYVVAFGVENTAGNRLNCMAANGGSGDPIYPENKQQLVDALTDIFSEIQEEARSFASAAVPTVQASVEDKIYLSHFTPLNRSSLWDGHLDAFLKPLPLVQSGPDAGRPDRSKRCSAGLTSGCLAWDAGEKLLEQAAALDLTATPPDYGMGDTAARAAGLLRQPGRAQPGAQAPAAVRAAAGSERSDRPGDLRAGLARPARRPRHLARSTRTPSATPRRRSSTS